MAITKIDNQAVGVVLPNETFQDLNKDCNCLGLDFCQLSLTTDTPQFQLSLTEFDGVELVTDGTFVAACATNWTCGAGWSIAGNAAILALAGAGNFTVVVANQIDFRQDHQYKIVFTVTNFAGGGVGTLRFGGFAPVDVTFTANGTVTSFVDMDNLPDGNFFFFGDGVNGFDISNFSIKEMSSIAINYKNITTGIIAFADSTNLDITYNYPLGLAQVLINWVRVSNNPACYNLCIIDKASADVDLIIGGDFTDPLDWVTVGDWTVAAGVASHVVGVGSFESTIEHALPAIAISGTACYTLTFDMLNYGAGTLTVYVILTGGGRVVIGTVSANQVGITMNFDFIEGRNIQFGTPNDVGAFEIDNVSLVLQDRCKAPVFETECFKVETSFDCNAILMTWTNDENAFGFNYESFTFIQKMRHCAKLYQPHYTKDDKETYRDSAGDRTLLYSSTTKVETFRLQDMPEYMHDALSIGIEHDTFTIDAVVYVNDENDYDPDWRTTAIVAPITLEMIKDNQNLTNSNC